MHEPMTVEQLESRLMEIRREMRRVEAAAVRSDAAGFAVSRNTLAKFRWHENDVTLKIFRLKSRGLLA